MTSLPERLRDEASVREVTGGASSYLADLLREAADALTWRDISTAPKDGTVILTYDQDGDVLMSHWFIDDDEQFGIVAEWVGHDWTGMAYDDFNPTHWMPLPLPPQEDKDG